MIVSAASRAFTINPSCAPMRWFKERISLVNSALEIVPPREIVSPGAGKTPAILDSTKGRTEASKFTLRRFR